ncbi:PQQ-dependent sugar dehydrogenase [Mariniblastus fucicola]|uniref:Quinoprotein glucose dehydrogenase B n=1 Tax=Mariniblastus fucicola TaxID=980251 RepID=A0A5B9P2B5_9BACT|nr:PQQ-dependent sugar dehydrogenase [Mariniblastus fucicola]QEG20478.1 Quinoprotein glucose dehydrogenase B precursor [Mariniblastus fucicola]
MRFASHLILSILVGVGLAAVQPDENDDGVIERVQWTTSKLKGTPDPPMPFATERIYESVELTRPTHMTRVPETDRWIVTQQNGKLLSFNRSGDPDVQPVVDLKQVEGWHFAAFGIAFHPEFPEQPWCYVTYRDQPKSETGAKLSRFRVVDPKTPKIKLNSEMEILKWRSHDHMGGQPLFGPDGYLYMSIGDGQRPTPPDPLNTGQDIGDLQASMLRIDVDNLSSDKNYSIPADNPFVDVPDARGEIWAFGVRNPWRLCFRDNGELWVGDVGWEMREMIYRIDPGANYGWSVKEGSQNVKPMSGAHSVPITKAILEHDHVEARSITGGFFWSSPRIPELVGAYIYGDWMTGKVWALKYDSGKEQIIEHRELVDTPLQIISFAVDDDGEVLIVGYDGTIHRLIPNPLLTGESQNAAFPRKLSETGLFESVADEKPSLGVIEYEINAHHWADGTTSRRWIGVVGDDQLSLLEKSNWMTGDIQGQFNFPHNTAIAKTIYLQLDPANPKSKRRVETQVLHRYHDAWMAYNYVWNQDQTDAILQENIAVEREFKIATPDSSDGFRKQKWLHSSRDQCMLCHIWSSGTVHAFKREQLNRSFDDEKQNQLNKFAALGLFEAEFNPLEPSVSPIDNGASLEQRTRAWLQLNCAHCHRQNGGGTGSFVLESSVSLEDMKLVDMPANQGDFGYSDTKLVVSGDPSRSVLLYRLMKSGHGRMPQFGTSVVDDQGVLLMYDWIKSLGDSPKDLIRREHACKAVLKYPDVATIGQLLESTSSAVVLAVSLSRDGVNVRARESIARVAARHENAEIRDLFERFLPASEQIERLGNNIDVDLVLSTEGDVERGKSLWFNSGFSCRNCHQIAGEGQMVGPSMDGIGSKRTKREILDSLLNPSVSIEENYRGHIVATEDGELISGLKLSEDENQMVIVNSEGKQHIIALDEIEESRPMDKSLMPEQLLADMTLQQTADLLEFLKSLK